MTKSLPRFSTEEEAFEWLESQVNDENIDNRRLAYQDDVEMMNEYEAKRLEGCCGEADYDVIIDGRLATIGCNYGH